MSFQLYLFIWLLGGFTATPLLLLAAAILIYRLSPLVHPQACSRQGIEDHLKAKATDAASAPQAALIKSGWLTVRRTYEPLPESYTGFITSGYKTFMTKDPRRNRPKDQFFAVLKRTASSAILFLYDGDPGVLANSVSVDCWAAIDLSLHQARLYPNRQDGPEAEMYMKKTAVVLVPKSLGGDQEGGGEKFEVDAPAAQGVTDSMEVSRAIPWFFVPKTNSDKEDWYHALLEATRLGDDDTAAVAAHGAEAKLYDPADMTALMSNIDAQEDQIPTRWLNAMLGRIFLGVYKTQAVEDYITKRILKKLSKVQRPTFLSEIKVSEVDVGNSTPLFSKPMLKELNPDGSASMEIQVRYKGNISVSIATVARVSLHKLKPVEAGLVLKVTLKELTGRLLFKIKPHPSNRVWIGFTSMPDMTMSVDPIVSSRQITWGPLLRVFESKIRELVAESIVEPNLDDTPFFDSARSKQRGGIFADTKREEHPVSELLAELLESMIPPPTSSENGPTVAADPGLQSETEKKRTCDTCGQFVPDAEPAKHVEEQAEIERPLPKAQKKGDTPPQNQHNKTKSWSWTGPKQFFAGSTSTLAPSNNGPTNTASSSTPNLATSSKSSRKSNILPSSSTASAASEPSSTIRNVPPPFKLPKESDESLTDSQAHSAMGQLRGVLQRDDLHRPESSPPGLQRRPSTSSQRSLQSEQNRPSRSSSIQSNLAQQHIHQGSSVKSRASSVSSQQSDASLDATTPTAEPDVPFAERPSSQASSLAVPLSDASPISSPERKTAFLPPPKRVVPPPRPSEGTLFETLKARANEKGVNMEQARNVVKRWGANWGKKQEESEHEGMGTDVHSSSEILQESRPRSASQPRPTVSGSGVSLGSGTATTSLSTSLGSSDSGPLSKAISSAGSPSPRRLSNEHSTSPGVYKPAPTMSIPAILSPAHRGGIGSDGPTQIVPQRPGDQPEPSHESRTSFIPPSLKRWSHSQAADAASTTVAAPVTVAPSAPAGPIRKVPPPFFAKKEETPEPIPAISTTKPIVTVQEEGQPSQPETLETQGSETAAIGFIHPQKQDKPTRSEESMPSERPAEEKEPLSHSAAQRPQPAADASEAGWQFDDDD